MNMLFFKVASRTRFAGFDMPIGGRHSGSIWHPDGIQKTAFRNGRSACDSSHGGRHSTAMPFEGVDLVLTFGPFVLRIKSGVQKKLSIGM